MLLAQGSGGNLARKCLVVEARKQNSGKTFPKLVGRMGSGKGETGDWSWGGAGPGWEQEGGRLDEGSGWQGLGVGGGARAREGICELSSLSHTHPQPPLMHTHSYTQHVHLHAYSRIHAHTAFNSHTRLCTFNHTCPHVLTYTCVQSHTCWHTHMTCLFNAHSHTFPHLNTYSHMPTHNTLRYTHSHSHIHGHTHRALHLAHLSNTYIHIMPTHSHMLIHVHTHTYTLNTHSHTPTHMHICKALIHTHRQPSTHSLSQAASHWWVCQGSSGWGMFGEGASGGEATVWTVGLGEAGCGNLQAFGRRPGLRDD